MTRSSWGAALTSGLLAGAVGLACLLGAVLRLSAVPQDAPRAANRHDAERGPRSTPVRSRDGAPEEQDRASPPREHRPPVRLWRGPTPEKHPPRPRRALA